MKILLFIFALCLATLGSAQGHGGKAADQMKQILFLQGRWHGSQDFVTGGPALVGDAHSAIEPAVGGRFMEEVISTTVSGRQSDTRHMLTFDPQSGKYKAWWFNDTSVGPTEFQGDCDGNALVMESLPGKGPTLRVTYEKVSATSLSYLLEMKVATGWQKLFKTTYRKES